MCEYTVVGWRNEGTMEYPIYAKTTDCGSQTCRESANYKPNG